jgi:hypothetical protein
MKILNNEIIRRCNECDNCYHKETPSRFGEYWCSKLNRLLHNGTELNYFKYEEKHKQHPYFIIPTDCPLPNNL